MIEEKWRWKSVQINKFIKSTKISKGDEISSRKWRMTMKKLKVSGVNDVPELTEFRLLVLSEIFHSNYDIYRFNSNEV